MSVRLLETEDKARWDAYVASSATACVYHQAGWKDVIEESFGHPTFYLLSEGADRHINGVLPLVQLKSSLFGNFLLSMPYFNYGGICADDETAHGELLAEAVAIAQRRAAAHIEFRDVRELEDGLSAKTSKVSMVLDLPQDSDELWRSFPSKLRSQIRRPTKAGMATRIGRAEELDSFYKVFSTNMRDLGTPVYSRTFFRNILRQFPDTTWIATAYSGEQAVASGFLVGGKDRFEIPWASSLREFNRESPNMLLYWTVLKFACEKRYTTFDFGRCTPNEGTYRFKKQWGAEPLQLYWYYWLRNGAGLPQLNPRNSRYALMVKLWQKLPVTLTRLIGPPIVKNLP